MLGCALFCFFPHASQTYSFWLQIRLFVPVTELTNCSNSLVIIFHPAVSTRLSQAGEQVTFAVTIEQMVHFNAPPRLKVSQDPRLFSNLFALPSIVLTPLYLLPTPSSTFRPHLLCPQFLPKSCICILLSVLCITNLPFTSPTTHVVISCLFIHFSCCLPSYFPTYY